MSDSKEIQPLTPSEQLELAAFISELPPSRANTLLQGHLTLTGQNFEKMSHILKAMHAGLLAANEIFKKQKLTNKMQSREVENWQKLIKS